MNILIYRDYNEVLKKLGTYEPVWFLEWNVNSISNDIEKTKFIDGIGKIKIIEGMSIPKAIEGMFISIDEQTGIFSSPKETLFVPFKDGAETYDSESLDFTMAREICLYSTTCWIFADSKAECYQQYVVRLKELSKKISDLLVLCKIPDKEHQDMRKIEKYEAKLEAIRIIIAAMNIAMKTPEELY